MTITVFQGAKAITTQAVEGRHMLVCILLTPHAFSTGDPCTSLELAPQYLSRNSTIFKKFFFSCKLFADIFLYPIPKTWSYIKTITLAKLPSWPVFLVPGPNTETSAFGFYEKCFVFIIKKRKANPNFVKSQAKTTRQPF